MRTRFATVALALALGITGTAGLAACSSDSSSTGQSAGQSTGALPPVIVEPTDLPGKSVELTQKDTLVINVTGEVEGWNATIDDPSIAEFTPGHVDDSASFNPSFSPKKAGTTGVSLTSPEGTVYEFSITVS